jgi:hypothetical protein
MRNSLPIANYLFFLFLCKLPAVHCQLILIANSFNKHNFFKIKIFLPLIRLNM